MADAVWEARRLGQSFWLDTLSRKLLTSGQLAALVRDGISGITSNPTIFEKAIAGTSDYDESFRVLVMHGLRDPKDLYERLAMEDIRAAADLLHPEFVATAGRDGYVSLEVSPHLAHDTEGTVREARRLFAAVGRPNVMIKVPGAPEGMPAIERLVSEGVNVNVTLLFGLEAYRACAEAHLTGLEKLLAAGGDVRRVAGVASFFLSRIDTVVDEALEVELANEPDESRRAQLESLRGATAIANAKVASALYDEMVGEPRWLRLAERGARPQRLLWASTGTKNPAYSKTHYVDPLIGADTISTEPLDTFRIFRDTARPRLTLREGRAEARATLRALAEVGISLREVTDQLLERGIQLFARDFDELIASLGGKAQTLLASEIRLTHAP